MILSSLLSSEATILKPLRSQELDDVLVEAQLVSMTVDTVFPCVDLLFDARGALSGEEYPVAALRLSGAASVRSRLFDGLLSSDPRALILERVEFAPHLTGLKTIVTAIDGAWLEVEHLKGTLVRAHLEKSLQIPDYERDGLVEIRAQTPSWQSACREPASIIRY
ncbi:hypothetical protein [Curtobacterium sp. MCBD17_019]|uniref:hypothetical protein n=1 Tax=Curtobacterium sp. MCBD17_019 TaxID=2175669 RepID=UPI000DA7CB16|nr:hypothetical protein [Curtobacterium sp. MCBD17_019]PZE77679.1 hypothetical protein DEI82_02355 [Curtobacterium sp. MCBD17_019]